MKKVVVLIMFLPLIIGYFEGGLQQMLTSLKGQHYIIVLH